MRAASKAKDECMAMMGLTDNSSTLASNSSVVAIGTDGRFASSHSLPALFVLACALLAPTT